MYVLIERGLRIVKFTAIIITLYRIIRTIIRTSVRIL